MNSKVGECWEFLVVHFFYTYVFCYFVCISGINHLKSIINGAFLFLCSYRNFVKASSVCWVEIFQYWFCIVFYTKAWSMMCEKGKRLGTLEFMGVLKRTFREQHPKV